MATDSQTSQLSPKRPSNTLENDGSPQISPNKRPKTLTLESFPAASSSSSSSSSKGKAKIEDELESRSCGICLSGDGNAVRGWIDSCDHYFCFVCIMEWAKVESRCPMCKRRFSTIRRPPKDGVFLSERVVNVPVRDQVYHYLGNSTIGPPNPYSEVQCSVCNSITDENLLLLCDLCDSGAHTYCVGLGATVPEGDWFCQDCTLLRAEHAKNETDTNSYSQNTFRNFHKMPLAETNVSIIDVVRESNPSEIGRGTTTSSNPSQLSRSVPDVKISVADGITGQGSRAHRSAACITTELGARTLQRRRHVQYRIQELRENWNAFQSGSLSFSSSSVDCGGCADKKHNIDAVLFGRSGLPHFTSCLSQQLTAQNGSSRNVLCERGSYDIDKAWKMMDVAKSIERDHRRTSILGSTSKQLGAQELESTGLKKHDHHHSREMDDNKHKSQMFRKQKQGLGIGFSEIGEGFPPTCSAGCHELPFSRKVQTSSQNDFFQGNGGKLPQENLLGASLGVSKEHDRAACLISAVWSSSVPSNISCAKLELHASSSPCKVVPPNGKGRIGKCCSNSKCKRDDGAKSEIQSLVKLNLKILSRDKKLEVDAFKKVAWFATHSILASCGLESLKPGVHLFPSSICHHSDEVRQLQRSTLMPNSCRECFYVFVKNAVKIIMFEKTASGKSSC